MSVKKSKFRPVGMYAAIALLVYGLTGALFNDIYLPGKYTGGIHLHYDAIPPALLGIALYALASVLDDLRSSRKLQWIRRGLVAGSIVAMAASCYLIADPPGRRIATLEECQATFAKLDAFTGSDTEFSQERAAQCVNQPMLKSLHDCVARADKPTDVNGCNEKSKRLFERTNAT